MKKVYRTFRPVPGSPWTAGEVEDICAVTLVQPETLVAFFESCLHRLAEEKGGQVGDYLEFGVFNGNSIGSMSLALGKRGMRDVRLFGFDAFEGLPAGSEEEDDGVWKTGFYKCSFPEMKDCLRRRGVDPEAVTWVTGWYKNTLVPETAARLGLGKIGVVFIDCDTYSSSKAVLDFLAPLVQETLIVCLDDWKLNDLDVKGMGEYRSFNEFLESNPRLSAEEIRSYNRKSKAFVVRVS